MALSAASFLDRIVPRVIESPGLAVTLATINTDPGGIQIPPGAIGLVLWFAKSTTDPTATIGRIAFNSSPTALSGLTGTDTVAGYQGPFVYQYTLPPDVAYLHLAALVAGVTAYGMWLT